MTVRDGGRVLAGSAGLNLNDLDKYYVALQKINRLGNIIRKSPL
jgi:hypothetical protein